MPPAAADPLLDLLLPRLSSPPPQPLASTYLQQLTTLPLSSLTTSEPSTLHSSAHTTTLALSTLASKSHKIITGTHTHLATLSTHLSTLSTHLSALTPTVPALATAITSFTSHPRAPPTPRHTAHTLHTALPALLDTLHLPALLASQITAASYPAALDTLAHIRRLQTLYPHSPAIAAIARDAEALQNTLITSLLHTLRAPLKLPAAMKTIGFYRRATGGGDARAVFLVCRLAYIRGVLGALEPLRVLAAEGGGGAAERYVKRWVEVFRELSFATVGLYRSIFATAAVEARGRGPAHSRTNSGVGGEVLGESAPEPLAGFVTCLVEMLREVLGRWLPEVREEGARVSLMTQVVYASGSLGRLGGEFVGVLMKGGAGATEEEWAEVVGRVRRLSGRVGGEGEGL